MTYKQKFNKKYGFKPNESHSLEEISKITGYDLQGIKIIFRKGKGAYKTNPQSVRPMVKSPEQWAYARVYSAVMGGKSQKIDKSHLQKTKMKKSNNTMWTAKQKREVAKLDKQFSQYLIKNNIDQYSYKASQAWKSKGFRNKFRKIFGKKPL